MPKGRWIFGDLSPKRRRDSEKEFPEGKAPLCKGGWHFRQKMTGGLQPCSILLSASLLLIIMKCTPISLTGAKKRRYNRQRNAFQPLTARSRERFPLSRGNKLSTERTEIPNLNRRRSGRQRIFIFPLPPDRFLLHRHFTVGNGLDRSEILPPLPGEVAKPKVMTEGWNKLPLMRELSAQLTEGEKSLIHFDLPSGNSFFGIPPSFR